MNYLSTIFLFLIILSTCMISCSDAKNIHSNKEIVFEAKKKSPKDWETALQKATSFKEETQLLKTLIQVDSTNIHTQLIANRLQTFDLRHLSEAERLTIIELYAASLVPSKNPAQHILQTAYAKLNAVYPTNNALVDKRLSVLIRKLKN